MSKKLTRRHRLIILLVSFLALSTLVFLSMLSIPIRSSTIKARVIALLSEELESEVTIDTLEGRLFPRVGVAGTGITVRWKGRTDVPPLLQIERFEIRGSFQDFMRTPRHVSEVRLQGLRVMIPPGDSSREDLKPRVPPDESSSEDRTMPTVIIDRFEAPDTVLTLIPGKPGKQAKVFTIHHLVMDSVGANQTMPYIATLTNPVPQGNIETSGTFGPWNVSHPAQTPVTGKYIFENANLDTIDGLAGILRSEGEFKGPLNRIEVSGVTDTPKFQIDAGGLPVPLKTRFEAVVDGSDGDTYLTRVDASFLHTELVASGAVVGIEGVKGRRIEVDVKMDKGRIEDLLRLAMDSEKPILVGAAQLQAKLVIPPEKKKVIDKINLKGEFGLSQAHFTDPTVQTKLAGFSRRGRGLDKDEPVGEVLSNLKGRFAVSNARADFSQLVFEVPGASVQLAGGYGLRTESLDFRGHLRMKATLSQVAGGGIKGLFLKVFDPFFKKPGAGLELPIRITGTRADPKFGLDLFGRKSGN